MIQVLVTIFLVIVYALILLFFYLMIGSVTETPDSEDTYAGKVGRTLFSFAMTGMLCYVCSFKEISNEDYNDLKLIAKEEPYKQLIQKFSANEKISEYENLIITTTMLWMEKQKSDESEKKSKLELFEMAK